MSDRSDPPTMSSGERRALLAELLRERSGALHPLSRGQRALWFAQQMSPDSATYNVMLAWRVRADLDVAALERAFETLVERHAVLRTTYVAIEGEPRQYVHEKARFSIAHRDASCWSEERLKAEVADDAHRPFDLESGPVLRVTLFHTGTNIFVVLLVVHHIAFDVWSLGVLLDELRVLYPAAKDGHTAILPPLVLQYTDYVRWQRDLLAGPEGESLWDYWRRHLDGELSVADLPFDSPRPTQRSERGAAHGFYLDAALTRGLVAMAEAEGTTLHTVLLAGFQLLISRYTGQTDVIVGTPAGGRPRPELAPIIGYFVNPLAQRVDTSGNPTFREFLTRVRETVLTALAHQEFPFPDLVERLVPVRELARPPLFQTSFVLQRSVRLERGEQLDAGASPFAAPSAGEPGTQLDLGVLRLESFPLHQRTVRLDLELQMVDVDGLLSGLFQYNADFFQEATIARLARNFDRLLRGIVTRPDERIAELCLVSHEERQTLLDTWNATVEPFDGDGGLHELVAAQARRTPDADAVLFEDGRLTYRELLDRAGRLAHRLRATGVGPGVPVALLVERSSDAVVGLLAILGAGGAAVPLDLSDPPERLAFMLDDCAAPVLLTQLSRRSNLPPGRAAVVFVGDEAADEPESVRARPDQAAFIFYTSGSTGCPKGVVLTHAGLCNCFQWFQRHFRLGADDRLLQKAPLSFDVSAWEIFWPLIAGAAVALARPGDSLDPVALVETMARHRVTLVQLGPSVLQLLLDGPELGACASLRRVICGGEVLSAETQARFLSRFDLELYNFYGPTEASVAVTYWRCRRDEPPRAVPIGRPIGNVTAYVLDAALQPVPIGVAGELYLGGVCLARGYFRRDELNAERFISHPFSDEPGARLYRSGDLVRYRPDGNLEFLGRIDRQLKLHGLRIEPGEIEAAMMRHPAVSEAVVVVRSEERIGRLVAYVVPVADAPADAELRHFLKRTLPAYMVPSTFIMLEALPRSPIGKLDLDALPPPARRTSDETYVAARSDIEARLVDIWQQLLHLSPVGVNDNFFELGGDSILAVQVVTRARQAGLALSPAQLFRHPTISELTCELPVAGFAPVTPWQQRVLAQRTTAARLLFFESTRRIDHQRLEDAVAALGRHHPALRLRFFGDETGWRQRASDDAGIALESVDLSRVSNAVLPPALEALGTSLAETLNVEAGSVCRVTLAECGPDRAQRLVVAIHPLIADPRSCAVLVQDLELAYSQAESGQPIELPSATTHFQEWAKRLGGTATTRPLSTEWKTYSSATVRVDALNTRAMREIATQHRVDFSTVVLAAVAQVTPPARCKRQLVLEVERDLHDAVPDLDTSRTVGAFTDVYTTVVTIDVHPGTGALLRSLKQRLATASSDLAPADLAFRYFGEMNGTLLCPVSLDGSTLGDGGGAAASRVDAWVSHEELHLCWRSEHATIATGELPHSLRALVYAGTNDEVSFVSADFPQARVSQHDLDALLSQVGSRSES